MTRTDLWFVLAFVFSVVAAVAFAFGNPLRLEGTKLQEFLGYIFGLVLAAAVLSTVMNLALFRRPTEARNRDATRTEVH